MRWFRTKVRGSQMLTQMMCDSLLVEQRSYSSSHVASYQVATNDQFCNTYNTLVLSVHDLVHSMTEATFASVYMID